MTVSTASPSPSLARLATYAKNPFTLVGFGLTAVSGIALAVLLMLEGLGVLENPYVGLVGFAILPGAFVAGLVAMPVGIMLRRRKLMKSGNLVEVPAFPRLDFNDAHVRRATLVVVLLTVVNAILLAASSAAALR